MKIKSNAANEKKIDMNFSNEKAKIINEHVISLILLFTEKIQIKSTMRDFILAKM